jgi:phage terminase small subunit
MALTPKQERFVEEYLVDLNATQAAIRAGYSPKTANEQASAMLAKPSIQEAVQAQRAKVSERTMRTVDDVMADIGRVRDNAMQIMTDPDTGGQVMLSHKDALKALELEGKHLGAFTERIEHSGPGGSAIPTIINLVAPNG